MKKSKKIQKKLEARQRGHAERMKGDSVWAKYQGAYRLPGSRKRKKG